MEKKINYQARDYEAIKSELLAFSEKYYPELTPSFTDNSVGEWLIDLVSAVGDELNYFIDRSYQETNINSATSRKALLAFAKNNGVKIPGPKASMCEIQLSCVLPVKTEGNNSQPDWSYAPLIKQGTVVGNSEYRFELTENVNFSEQFNDDGYSNRTFVPNRNSNNVIVGYTVTKTTVVTGGQSKVFKKVLTRSDVYPFMKVTLPDNNISQVESIIFKESASYNKNPQTYEFFIDEEQFLLGTESVATYRYFEVDSMSTQYHFGPETDLTSDGNKLFVTDAYSPSVYEDYTETGTDGSTRTMRFYKGKWKPLTQKYTTEYTDRGFMEITFGCSNGIQEIPSGATSYGEYRLSKMLNNDCLGVLPKIGWTMFVLYRTGGGIMGNIAKNSITNVLSLNMVFPLLKNSNEEKKNSVVKSLKVDNTTVGIGGKDHLSNEELKEYIKYYLHAQDRCVTLKDYKMKLLSMPPKFGAPFRCNAIEENNKVVIPMLFVSPDNKLSTFLPQTLVDNAKEYLKNYKSLSDYIEFRSGKIYHLGFEVDVYVDKNYTPSDVIKRVVDTVSDYMDINKHDMGEDIFIGDLEKEINKIDGIVSLIELRVFNLYDGQYSPSKSPLPRRKEYDETGTEIERSFSSLSDGAKSFQISLNETDGVLYDDYDSQYEILNKNKDIAVRCKLT